MNLKWVSSLLIVIAGSTACLLPVAYGRSAVIPARVPDTSAKMLTLEQRVAELEANQSLNIFSLGGIFITRYDNLSTSSDKNMQYLRLQFSLNLDANVSKNIQFYSRYTTTKFMTRWRDQGTSPNEVTDLNASDNYANSNVVLEKAYMDLSFTDHPVTLSVGRLPTVDGPPSNYWDGRARMGTYPLLTYSAILDGVAGTYKFDQRLPANEHLALRAMYTPFSQYNSGTAGAPGYLTPPKNTAGSRLQTLVSLYSLQVDYALENVPYADSANYIVQYYQTGEFNLAGNLNVSVRGTSFMAELNGIGGSPFDISLNYLMTDLRSLGYATTVGTGYGTNADDEDLFGDVSLVSARYRMDKWFLGLEWIHGSRKNSYYSGASENLTNLYGTRGHAYHLYVTKKLEENLSLRLGFSQQNVESTPITVGSAPVDSSNKIETLYLQMRLDF